MDVAFERTDRLISLIDNAVTFLSLSHIVFEKALKLKAERPALYQELLDINTNEPDVTKKRELTKGAFAKEYKKEGDIFFGEGILKATFDEDQIFGGIWRRCWQLKGRFITGDLTDTEKLKSFLNDHSAYGGHPYFDILISVLQASEPDIADIEAEFWKNCQNTDDIGKWCDIYYNRFKGHLKEVDRDYFDWNNTIYSNSNPLNPMFKELRATGLLNLKESYAEVGLSYLCEQVNTICDDIYKLFTKLREYSKPLNNSSPIPGEQQHAVGVPVKITNAHKALLAFHNGDVIDNNASGALRNQWSKYNTKGKIIAVGTKRENTYKVKLLKEVIEMLDGQARSNAEGNLAKLKENIIDQPA